jgi:acetyl esterase/lipase
VERSFTIPIWPEGLPTGSEDWTQQEVESFAPPPLNFRQLRNVTNSTLTAFLPEAGKANGTAVVICPGGAFHALAIDHEGNEVARWFVEHGVAAFVLKYRLVATPQLDDEYETVIQALLRDMDRLRNVTQSVSMLAIADARQSLRLVHQRASEWGIAPNKIGIMGFSAGGHVTAGTALEFDRETRPDFAAPIYGALISDFVVPSDAPPLFIAVAQDDALAAESCLKLYSSWKAAGHPAELHIYAAGGHGFGMRKQNLPCDNWIERLGDWLRQQNLMT